MLGKDNFLSSLKLLLEFLLHCYFYCIWIVILLLLDCSNLNLTDEGVRIRLLLQNFRQLRVHGMV